MDHINIPEIVQQLGSNEDGTRKMAAFKLQSCIGDPSLADVFVHDGGLIRLKRLCLSTSGNTLAYSLTSLAKLLEIDQGWSCVDQDLVYRIVELIVAHPLVNILRGAMAILVAVVSHSRSATTDDEGTFGFKALKPTLAAQPQFLEILVSRLSSADHGLCANALQLINALMRDAIASSDSEWPKFVKRLRDLGVITAVYTLMQSNALSDLAQPLLEFQLLTKVIIRKQAEVPVDLARSDHRRALRGIYKIATAGMPEFARQSISTAGESGEGGENWALLGLDTESPGWDFEDVGFLGMMDLMEHVRGNDTSMQNLLLEQSMQDSNKRCPSARASLAVTSILYEHFDIDSAEIEDAKPYMDLDTRSSIDRLFKPALLQWSILHVAGFNAFLRVWKDTGATVEEFDKVSELVRILIEAVVGGASRTREINTIEEGLNIFTTSRLRELQMELLELSYEDSYGQHIRQTREELDQEALAFLKEQRIRCLLNGSWFRIQSEESPANGEEAAEEKAGDARWRFVKLNPNRRFLHYGSYERTTTNNPSLEELSEKVDLNLISSVTPSQLPPAASRPASIQIHGLPLQTITISTYVSASKNAEGDDGADAKKSRLKRSGSKSKRGQETPLLVLAPGSRMVFAEWLDGLLMLLGLGPTTPETAHLLKSIAAWSLKIRLLNVKFEDQVLEDEEGDTDGGRGMMASKRGEVPSREGLNEDYYYEIFAGA